jgi:superfamily II DNA or RNA helicase
MIDVDIAVNNIEGRILTPLSMDQLAVIQQICSFKVEGSEYKSAAFRNRKRGGFEWDGYRRLFNIQSQTFPIGLLSRIRSTFAAAQIGVNVIIDRQIIPQEGVWSVHNTEDRQYQNQAVMSSILHGSGIVKGATGCGKTTIGAKTIAAYGRPSVFIVHTRDLLYQTIESFRRILDVPVGQIGDGVVHLQPVTVATVQTLSCVAELGYESYKYDEEYGDNNEKLIDIHGIDRKRIMQWSHTIGTLIFDETQRVCSRTAYAARFMFRSANNVYGYSASPWRDDGSDLMIEAAFGPRIVDISASELIRLGYLVRPEITIKELTNNIWSGKTYEQIYKSAIVENVFRNMQVTSDACEQYDIGRCTLVLVTQIQHGDRLESMIRSAGKPAIFISGKSGMKRRREVISDMRAGKSPIVIASTIADVGLDVPRLVSIVEAGAGKSSVTALQRLGRIMRPFDNKDMCYFTTYHDMAPYINTQIDNKIRIWQTEPEFIIRHMK